MSTTTHPLVLPADALHGAGPIYYPSSGGVVFVVDVNALVDAYNTVYQVGGHAFSYATYARDQHYVDSKEMHRTRRGNEAAISRWKWSTGQAMAPVLNEWMHYCDAVVDAADTATDDDDEPAVTIEAVRQAMKDTWATFPADAERVMALDATDTLETREAIDVALERLSLGDLDTVLTTARELGIRA